MEYTGFDTYDIQCLLHVYNKFGNRYEKQSATNINELNLFGQPMKLYTDSYYENHQCVISDELAIFIEQPIGSILTPKQVTEMVIKHCFDRQLIMMDDKIIDDIETTYDEDEDRNDYECTKIILTAELKQLLKVKRTNNISTRSIISYLHKHFTMIEPTEKYVLK